MVRIKIRVAEFAFAFVIIILFDQETRRQLADPGPHDTGEDAAAQDDRLAGLVLHVHAWQPVGIVLLGRKWRDDIGVFVKHHAVQGCAFLIGFQRVALQVVLGLFHAHTTDDCQRTGLVTALQIGGIDVFIDIEIGRSGLILGVEGIAFKQVPVGGPEGTRLAKVGQGTKVGKIIGLASGHIGQREIVGPVKAVIDIVDQVEVFLAQAGLCAKLEFEVT